MVKYPTYVHVFSLTKYDMEQFDMMNLFSHVGWKKIDALSEPVMQFVLLHRSNSHLIKVATHTVVHIQMTVLHVMKLS